MLKLSTMGNFLLIITPFDGFVKGLIRKDRRLKSCLFAFDRI